MVTNHNNMTELIDEHPDGTVTISAKRYKQLMDDSEWLRCLEAAGVDNWEGFSYAQEMQEAQASLSARC